MLRISSGQRCGEFVHGGQKLASFLPSRTPLVLNAAEGFLLTVSYKQQAEDRALDPSWPDRSVTVYNNDSSATHIAGKCFLISKVQVMQEQAISCQGQKAGNNRGRSGTGKANTQASRQR